MLCAKKVLQRADNCRKIISRIGSVLFAPLGLFLTQITRYDGWCWQLVGSPPLEPKRKRENVGDMDLRPGALLGPGYGLGTSFDSAHHILVLPLWPNL